MYVDLLDDSKKFVIQHFQNIIPVRIEDIVAAFEIRLEPFNQTQEQIADLRNAIKHTKSDNILWDIDNGMITYDEEEEVFVIHYNNQKPRTRQRFTIAHELAHFLVHREEIVKNGHLARGKTSGYTNGKEAQANFLAAEILMPMDKIKEKVKEIKETQGTNDSVPIAKIAKEFEVSAQAMEIRLSRRYKIED